MPSLSASSPYGYGNLQTQKYTSIEVYSSNITVTNDLNVSSNVIVGGIVITAAKLEALFTNNNISLT